MKILYVVSEFPCWSETFIVREIQALLAAGEDIRILSLKTATQTLVHEDARRLLDRVIYPAGFGAALRHGLAAFARRPLANAKLLGQIVFGLWRRPVSLAKSLVVWWRSLVAAGQLRDWVPDAIHAHWATYPSTAALVLARNLDVPFSFTSHAHDIFLENQLLEQKIRDARFAVTISRYNRQYLGDTLRGVDPDKIHIVHCGVVLDAIPFERGGRDPRRVLAIGRLDEVKGFPVLLDACRHLRDRGVDFQCDIVGEGPLRPQLEAALRRVGLEDRVRFLGAQPQDEVRRRLREAGLFVLPSVVAPNGNRDGIPVALMEAMAAGVPVVTTRVSGIPELVEDGISGCVAEPGDAADLAERMAELLGSPALGDRLARHARAKVEREFDVVTETRRLHGLLRSDAGARHASEPAAARAVGER